MHRYVLLAIIGCILMQQIAESASQAGVDCTQPLTTGPCRAGFKRYGYDTATKQCTMFIYGGCRGNSNRFHSMEECQAACEEADNHVGGEVAQS